MNNQRCRQLTLVNEKISRLAQAHPKTSAYTVFMEAARLARRATEIAVDLSDVDGRDVGPVLDFWRRLSDYAGTAALNCAGGNETLTEALITYQFLRIAGKEKTNAV